jgi:DNA repair protein RadD
MNKLRDYQRDAIDSIRDYWANGGGNPLIEAATGTGKSVIIANLCRELFTQWPDLRVLSLVHVRELVEQNAKTLIRYWQQAPIGINSAGLGRRDYHSQILFASIQSVFKRPELLGPRDVLLIDEAHLVPRDGEGMYRTLIEKLRDAVPDLRVCGFTATGYRLDSGRLDAGDSDRLFDDLVFSYGLADAVSDGWLAPLISKATKTEIDVSGVTRRGGEFIAGALETAADKIDVVEGACDEIVAMGESRRAWLAFCSGVEHAFHVRDALRRRGVTCETVTGDTPNGERDRIIKAYRNGQIRCLTNANVLTTGFDVPFVDLAAMLRPTLSTSLYVQMLGRGTRPVYPAGFDPNNASKAERLSAVENSSKPHCLVLDFAGNCRRHGPVDAVVVRPKKKGENPNPERTDPDTIRAKICPNCQTYNGLSTLECVSCGFQWPKPEPKHSAKSETAPVMTREVVAKWLPVSDVTIDRHAGGSGIPSLVVEYRCGLQSYREWVCLEHRGFAASKAEAWWRVMGGKMPAPKTVDDAMKRAAELSIPHAITIQRDGKYWRVCKYQLVRGDGRHVEIDEKYRVSPAQGKELAIASLPPPKTKTFDAFHDTADEIPF